MKRVILTTLILIVSAVVASGQLLWSKRFGGEEDEAGYDILEIDDNSLLLTGETSSYGVMPQNIWLLKIDLTGDTIWTKTYGFDIESVHRPYIKKLNDGNIILLSYKRHNLDFDTWILKLNSDGDTIWTKTYRDLDISYGGDLLELESGDMLLAGISDFSVYDDIYLIKINENGDTLWTHSYGNESTNRVYNLIMLQSGDVIMSGVTLNSETGTYDILLTKLDTINGDTIWTKMYGNDDNELSPQIMELDDGNILMTAVFDYTGKSDLWLLKLDSNGDTLWTRMYGGNGREGWGYFPQVMSLNGGNIFLEGSTQSFGAGDADIWLLKLDSTGDTIWSRTYGGMDGDGVSRILKQHNGNFLLLGGTTSFYGYISGPSDLWLLCIPPDQYAYNNTLFSYKIVFSSDSTAFLFEPLTVPDGMFISEGGTVTWTPQTDSVFALTPEFIVSNSQGYADTVSFVLWVNVTDGDYPDVPYKHISGKPEIYKVPVREEVFLPDTRSSIRVSFIPSKSNIRIRVPFKEAEIEIYTIRGELVNCIQSKGNNEILWNGRSFSGVPVSSGSYYIRVKAQGRESVKQAVFMR